MVGLRDYQHAINLNHLYEIRLAVSSGLGETIAPRITNIGGTVKVYGAEERPVGLTLDNLATKMALIRENVAIESFLSLPNYLIFVQKTGITTSLILSAIDPEDLGEVV